LAENIAAGRHVFVVRSENTAGPDGSDTFFVVDVKR
jgi:hypothetical protein